jgi:hypothetical protein
MKVIRSLFDRLRRKAHDAGANVGLAPDGSPVSSWIEHRFEPKADITTQELAKIVQYCVLGEVPLYFPKARESVKRTFTDEQWAWLDHLRQRHFRPLRRRAEEFGGTLWTCATHGGAFRNIEGCAACIAEGRTCPASPVKS